MSRRTLNLIFIGLWLAFDTLAIAFAFLCAHYVRFTLGWPPPEEIHALAVYYRLWLLLTGAYLGMLLIYGLYRPERRVAASRYGLCSCVPPPPRRCCPPSPDRSHAAR